MNRWTKTILFLLVAAVLLAIPPVARAAQPQLQTGKLQKNQTAQLNVRWPVKLSFDITHPQNFWSAVLSKDGGVSWAGLPANVTIRVIAGDILTYSVYHWTPLPYNIDTGDLKLPDGTNVVIKVEVNSKNGDRITDKFIVVPVNGSVFKITLEGPPQPVVYKPVIVP